MPVDARQEFDAHARQLDATRSASADSAPPAARVVKRGRPASADGALPAARGVKRGRPTNWPDGGREHDIGARSVGAYRPVPVGDLKDMLNIVCSVASAIALTHGARSWTALERSLGVDASVIQAWSSVHHPYPLPPAPPIAHG